MRSISTGLVMGGLLIGVAGAACAQTTYLDTLQKFTISGSGQTFIGDDPGNSTPTGGPPTSAATSGYAVIPFAVKAGASGTDALSSVSIAGEFMPPTGSTSNLGSLYGVLIQNPTGNSLRANAGNVVGGFFQFNTAGADQGGSNAGKGNGQFQNFTANVTGGATLSAGTSYWLVILPKSDLTPASDADPLAHYFQLESKTSIQLGNTQNGPLATEAIGQQEGSQVSTITPGGAQPGDVLAADPNRFYGVRITGSSVLAVPETSTLMSLGIGLLTAGGAMVRRRRAK